MYTFDEDEVARLNRRLLVVEQLMRVAATDPLSSPFAMAHAADFYIGLAEIVAEIRQALPGVAVEIPTRVARFAPR